MQYIVIVLVKYARVTEKDNRSIKIDDIILATEDFCSVVYYLFFVHYIIFCLHIIRFCTYSCSKLCKAIKCPYVVIIASNPFNIL